jgi:hypothetical protein
MMKKLLFGIPKPIMLTREFYYVVGNRDKR